MNWNWVARFIFRHWSVSTRNMPVSGVFSLTGGGLRNTWKYPPTRALDIHRFTTVTFYALG